MASSIIMFEPLTLPSLFSTSSCASTLATTSFHFPRSSTVSCKAHLKTVNLSCITRKAEPRLLNYNGLLTGNFVTQTTTTTATAVEISRRGLLTTLLSGCIAARVVGPALAQQQTVEFREYIDFFDGYSLTYPKNWIQVKGAGADIFFRDPYVLDENLSVDISSPSSSTYKSVADLGSPEEAGKKMLKKYLTEFMSTRLGVRREAEILSTSSRVADDGRLYYLVEVNIKSYANNNELAVMPEERVVRREWDRRYLSVLGVENNRLYELRLQTPEKVFREEESDLRRVIASFRVNKVTA